MKKRKIVSALLVASMAISLAGCSSTASSGGASGTGASGDKTVVEVWTNDRHDLDYVTSQIDEFNSTNTDNIEIKQTVITDDLSNMLSMATSSGTAPDIAVTSGSSGIDMKVFADANMVLPLNSYVEAAGEEFETVTENSKHQFEGMNVIEGQLYWVPTVVRSGSRMIYNDTLTTEAGMTEFPSKLEDMVTLSQTITTNGAGKYYGMAATNSSPFVRSLEGIAEMSGQNRYGYDYVNGKFDFSGFKDVIEVYQGLLAKDSLLPGSATQGVDAMRAQFADGTVGLWANASQEAGVFTTQFPVESFEWKVAELPTLNDEVVGALSSMPQKGYMIMSSSKNPDAAWKVIEFFSSEDFLKGYIEEGFALPFSDKMTSVVDSEKAGRITDFALKDYESVYPVAPSVSLEGDNLQVVLWSAAMGERDIDTAIEDLNTRYNAALEKDISMGKVKRLIIKDYDPLHPNDGTATYTE